MKRAAIIFAVALCFILTDKAHAQRALPGMRGLEIRGGMVDGFYNNNNPYKAGRIPVAQFTGEGGYYYKFLSDGSKTFFFSLGASALAGYETVNWGDKLLYDGSTIRNKDAFLYGGAITLEMEAYLTDKVILVLTGRERILWGTSSGHFHTQFGVAIKFMIN